MTNDEDRSVFTRGQPPARKGLALSVSHTEAFRGDSENQTANDALTLSRHMLVTLTRVEMTQAGTTLPSPTLVRIL